MYTPLKKATFTAVITLILGATPFMLQAENLPDRGPIPFSTYDKNSDGSLSETEYYDVRSQRMQQRADEGRPMRNAGNAPEFSDFDSNQDGKITPEELQTGQDARMQQRGGRGQGMGQKSR